MAKAEENRRGKLSPQNLQVRETAKPIYLSWEGKIYGPSSKEEILSGLRTGWFERGTVFWHEGLDTWKPLGEFPDHQEGLKAQEPQAFTNEGKTITPPSAPKGQNRMRSRRSRPPKTASRRLGRRGRAIFYGFAFLAVLLTVGLILLLMMV